MNRFEKFFGASSALNIEGVELNVYPMSISDSILLSVEDGESKDSIMNKRCKLILNCLRDESLTLDDVKKFRQDIFLAILAKVIDVSEESAKTNERALGRIKEQIAKRQTEEGKSSDAPTN